MENNTNNTNGGKVRNFFQKMYHFRVKVDKQGKPIVNVSSLFGLACLLFAPHMTLVGVIAALVMGYSIHFETEDMDDKELEERFRKAAQNVKTGAMNAARSIQNEINKAKAQNAPAPTAREAEKAAEEILQKAQEAAVDNAEILKDLESHANETPAASNPAATTFHSAYAASAASVPVLRVEPENGDTPEPKAPAARGSAE